MIVVDVIIYLILFYIGACLGRYVLNIKKKDIEDEEKEVVCNNCKKGVWKQNIPIISYFFTKGRCAHCERKDLVKEFLTEFGFGSIFFILSIIFPIGIGKANRGEIAICIFSFIYIGLLLVIAAYDKKEHGIKKGALLIGFIMESIYMVYSYIIGDISLYVNFAYLLLLFIFLMIDTILLRKKGKSNYTIQILMLCMYMVLFTQDTIFMMTVIFTLLVSAIYLLTRKIVMKKAKYKTYKKKEINLPIGFYLCVTNIILFMIVNLIGWKI